MEKRSYSLRKCDAQRVEWKYMWGTSNVVARDSASRFEIILR